jgi:hypothetical protein
MTTSSRAQTAAACPHVDRNDARCAARLSIARLDQAFSVCFGSYRGCALFHRINAEDGSSPPHTTLTADGRALPIRHSAA